MSKKRDGLTLRNGIWYLSYKHRVSGKRIRLSADTSIKPKAAELRERLIAESWDQKNLNVCPEITVNELLDWAKTIIWQDIDPKTTEYVLKRIRDYFGWKVANDLSIEDILKFRGVVMAEGLTITAVNRPLCRLKTAYKLAINMGKLLKNPVMTAMALNAPLFSENKKGKEIYLDLDEESQLISHCPGTLGLIVAFALRTGMSQGEILRLEWTNLDFKTMKINTWRRKGRGKKMKWRKVTILPDIIDILAKLPRNRPWIDPKDGKEHNFVFSYEDGSALSRHGVVSSSYRKITMALAKTNPKFHEVTFHSLRHTFASQYLMHGGRMKALADILGHSSIATTEIYGHLDQDHLTTQMNLMPRLKLAHIGQVGPKLGTEILRKSKIVDTE